MRLRSRSVMWLVCGFAALAISARAEPSTAKLASWYSALGEPRPSESFGHYHARTARIQHGVKYEENSESPGAETLDAGVDAFECVSFIESTLAVARCAWESEPTASCFVGELEATRYRGGRMGDYASRLHYFVDWIGDNENRGRLVNMTASLGGEPVQKDFFYITEREWQTAITAWWMVAEGHGLFDAITPLMGPPWQIPMCWTVLLKTIRNWLNKRLIETRRFFF